MIQVAYTAALSRIIHGTATGEDTAAVARHEQQNPPGKCPHCGTAVRSCSGPPFRVRHAPAECEAAKQKGKR